MSLKMPNNTPSWEEAVDELLEEYDILFFVDASKKAFKSALNQAVKDLVQRSYPHLAQVDEIPQSTEEYKRTVKLLDTYQANIIKAIEEKSDGQ